MKKVEDMSRQDRCDRWQDQLSQLRHCTFPNFL